MPRKKTKRAVRARPARAKKAAKAAKAHAAPRAAMHSEVPKPQAMAIEREWEKKPREPDYKRPEDTPGFGLRVALSIVVFFGLIAFVILWLFFFADSFNLYQNLAMLLIAILVFVGLMGAGWASWGIKYGRKFEGKGCCR